MLCSVQTPHFALIIKWKHILMCKIGWIYPQDFKRNPAYKLRGIGTENQDILAFDGWILIINFFLNESLMSPRNLKFNIESLK